MNFSYGIIAAVGILVAISIGFIAISPDEIIEPRVVEIMEEPVPVMVVRPSVLVTEDTVGSPLIIEVEFRDDEGQIVDHVNYDIFAIQNNQNLISDEGAHRHPGKHPVHTSDAELTGDDVEIKIVLQGLGHGDEISEPIGTVTSSKITPVVMEPEPEPEPEQIVTASMPVAPEIHQVNVAEGSGSPGCDETNECFLPSSITISIGDTVQWNNADTAAHTITSGSAQDGVSGLFDSSLFMSGETFEFTFEKAGTYDYFCMVHPWMTGVIHVE